MNRSIVLLALILATSGCYFSSSSWKTELESVGWSKNNEPLFLERFPEGVDIKGPKEAPVVDLRPSEWKYVLHGPSLKRKEYTVSFPGHLFYSQIMDECHVILIGRTNLSNVAKLSILELNINSGVQRQLMEIDYSKTAPAEIRFSKDYSFAGLATETGVDVVNVKTGAVKKYLTEYRVQTIEFSYDSRFLAAYVQRPYGASENAQTQASMTTVSDDKGKYFLIGIAVLDLDTGNLHSMNPVEPACYENVLDFAPLNYEAKNYMASPETSQLRLRVNLDSDNKPLLTGTCMKDGRNVEQGRLYLGAYSPSGSMYGFFRKGKKMLWIDSRTGKNAGEYELMSTGQ